MPHIFKKNVYFHIFDDKFYVLSAVSLLIPQTSGSEVAKLLKPGVRVVRGPDWKWGEQDGQPVGEGCVISEVSACSEVHLIIGVGGHIMSIHAHYSNYGH